MNLHTDDYGGGGAPLLFIHGWGMHGLMWGELLPVLSRHYHVLAVDLPGYGLSTQEAGTPYLDFIVDTLSKQFTEPVTLCGWSMGGQIALRWALRYPLLIEKLVLISTTPCFVQQEDWPCAMANDTLSAFAASLQQDEAATLRRFLALMARGSDNERALLVLLRRLLQSRGKPSIKALLAGLKLLLELDLRKDLPQINTPALVISGIQDTLTPPDASRYLAAQMTAQLATIKGASHVPFLSHPDIVAKHIVDFLQ
jgi:pimeloyl-[acyl-carrier protein] methyl ester esterase